MNYEALRLTVQRSDGSNLQRQMLEKKLEKQFRSGQLSFDNLTSEWKWRLCGARMMLDDYSSYDGWEYRDEFSQTMWEFQKTVLPFPMWDGNPIKRLRVFGEQGVGDEVLWASILVEVISKCGEVVFECEERLHPIFQRIPGIICEPRRDIREPRDGTAWILEGDLARLFRHKLSDFPGTPYIPTKPSKKYAGYVGLSWAGRCGKLSAEELLTAASKKYPNSKFVNLQYDQTSELIEQPGIDLKDDLEGVFNLIASLDRVICVPTSVAHFAGSQGVPVEVIVAPRKTGEVDMQLHWTWSVKNRIPWYSCLKLYHSLQEYGH